MREDTLGQLYAPELEQSALQALMSRVELWDEYSHLLGAHLFTVADHRRIFAAMSSIRESGGTVGPDTIVPSLMKEGIPTAESSRLLQLLVEPMAHLHDAEDLCFLADLSMRRKLQEVSAQIGMRARDLSEDIADIVEAARKSLDAAEEKMLPADSGVLTLTDAFEQLKTRMAENQLGESGGSTPTGFPELDKRGGLLAGHLVIVGGRTSQGKSSLATCICVNAIRGGKRMAYYTLEMTAQEEGARIVASMTGLETSAILNKPLNDAEINAACRSMKTIEGDLMFFDERATTTAEGIIRSIRELHRTQGIDGAVVDFLQRLSFPAGVKREQGTAEAVKKFKNLAKELGIWVMVLSQISRGANEGEAPTLSGLRDSGQIEEAADEVWLIHRPEVYGAGVKFPAPFTHIGTEGRALVRIAKGRNTGTGEFICRFNSRTCAFTPESAEVLKQDDPLEDFIN